MERFTLSITRDEQTLHFEVADYVHHEHNGCKFEIYQNNVFVAGLNPDGSGHLTVCKNPGNVNKETLHLLADKIESFHF